MGFNPATLGAVSNLIGGGQQLGAPAAPGIGAQPPQGLVGGQRGLGPSISQLVAQSNAAGEQPAPPVEQPAPPSNIQRGGIQGGEGRPGFLDAFFGNLDQNLQSPSKLLGVGLLNQLKPGLGTGGLGLAGLLGALRR